MVYGSVIIFSPEGDLFSGILSHPHRFSEKPSGDSQPEERGEVSWDAEYRDARQCFVRGTSVASEALSPAETSVGALCAGEESRLYNFLRWESLRQAHVNPLVVQELHHGTAMHPARPVVPEQGVWAATQWMQQYTDLAGLRGFTALPLALLAQRTGTATANAGSIHDAQASVGFSALLMGDQLLVSGTTQRPIGLESEVLAREATGLPCGTHFWRGRARGGSGVW
jgi:hypothetical protein